MRTGWKDNTTLQELVRCVDRDGGAQMVAEITVATRDALKQLESEWEAADSTSGFEFRPDGTVRLRNTPAAAIDKLTGRDGVRTGLSLLGGSGDVARIRWDAGQSSQTQISDITVRLNPKVGGAGKTVAYWKLQLYYKDVSSGVTQLTPLLWDPVTVPAPGDFESDVTFDLSGLNQRPQPLVMGDLGAGQPTTFVEVWGVQADGVTLATNVGWARDSTVPNYTASGNTLEGYTLTKAFSDTYNLDFWSEIAWGYPPIIRVRFVTYSGSATLSFTGANLLDLGAVPTGTVEFGLQKENPGGSSITGQIRNDADAAWITYKDGQTSDDIGVSKRQTYKCQWILTADATGRISPVLRLGGVRELTRSLFPYSIRVSTSGASCDPIDLKAEIETVTVAIIRDGERDYRDRATELLVSNDLVKLELRLFIGRPSWLSDPTLRELAMLRGLYQIVDWKETDGNIILQCLSPLNELKAALPIYDDTGLTREPLQYPENTGDPYQSLTEVYDDLIDGQLGLAERYRGPGVSSSILIRKRITDSDAKVEADSVAALAGGVIGESQGKLKYIDLMGDNQAVQAVIPQGHIIWGPVGPGYDQRLPEYFVNFGFDFDTEEYEGEWRGFQGDVITKLGRARLMTTPRLADEIAKWIPETAVSPDLPGDIASRMMKFFGSGFIALPFRTIYAYPELELGDLVAAQTDRLVARDPIAGRAIRGRNWVVGRIIAVDDLWGTAFTLWVRSLDDVVAGNEAARRLGFELPEVLACDLQGDPDGVVRAIVRAKDAAAVYIATSTAAQPTRDATLLTTPVALGADGNLSTGTLATIDPDDTLYVSVIAVEQLDGTGATSETVGEFRIRRVPEQTKSARFSPFQVQANGFDNPLIIDIASGYVYPAGVAPSGGIGQVAFPLPVGVTITEFRVSVSKVTVASPGDTVKAYLFRDTTLIATAGLADSAGPAGASEQATACNETNDGDSYWFKIQCASQVTITDARVYWVEITYTVPSYYETY